MTGTVLLVFSFVLGAIIGSFLNACIHRMPRNIPLNEPKRSFCPQCNRQIPWYENLPIISWLILRGKCSGCGAKIPVRYLIVELLTAGLFAWCWQAFGWPVGVAYWLFVAILVASTFIDFEHLIIPDELTIGGTIAGVILCTIFPQMLGESVAWRGLVFSVIGAMAGFFLLWGVVEAGKLAFGKKRHRFPKEEIFSIKISDDKAVMNIGEDEVPWEDIFSRESDVMVLEGSGFRVLASAEGESEKPVPEAEAANALRVRYDRVFIGDKEFSLTEIREIHGTLSSLIMPREAMGFGDVKFIAAIGAFLGWQAALFTIFRAAALGAVVGVTMLIVTRGKEGGRIPFGPYLALGALIWMAGGIAVIHWYLEFSQPPPY